MVLPPAPLVEQEAKELEYAKESVARINVPRSRLNDAWVEKGWIESHVLAVVWMPALKVCLARIAHNDEKSVKRLRQGGVIIERHVFENRFAAQAAKGELLLAVARWRLVLPGESDREGKNRGLVGKRASAAPGEPCGRPSGLEENVGPWIRGCSGHWRRTILPNGPEAPVGYVLIVVDAFQICHGTLFSTLFEGVHECTERIGIELQL